MSDIFQIFSGQFEIIELIVWICLTFGLWAFFLFIAYKKFPPDNHYSIMTCTISYLGAWTDDRNPKGWYFFSIGLSILSIMLFPLLFYIYNRIILINYNHSLVILILLILGNVGIILIAIFPDNEVIIAFNNITYAKMHLIVAIAAFGCYGLSFLHFFWLILYDGLFGAQLLNTLLLLPPFIILIFIVCLAAYSKIKWIRISKYDETKEIPPGYGFYSSSMWEWIVVLSFFSVIICVLLFLPN